MTSPATVPRGPVIVGLEGPVLTAAERHRLRHPLVGGVILFERNAPDTAALRALVAEVRALRVPPLLVTVDQEGGRVQRLRDLCAPLPPAGVLRAGTDARGACRRARAAGLVMAADCRALGIDLSFAPVLDLDRGVSEVIGTRAFARTPEQVTALAGAFVDGMAAAGMAAVGKHFPGHGAVAPDTHTAAAVDERRRAGLDEDLAPFAALGSRLGAVMLAHVVYPAVAPQPAGYAPAWIGGVLRGELGFAGAAISDDLGMAGGAGPGEFSARAQAALDAGCDAVLVCNALAELDALLDALRWSPGATHAARLEALAGGEGVRPGAPEYEDARRLLADLA